MKFYLPISLLMLTAAGCSPRALPPCDDEIVKDSIKHVLEIMSSIQKQAIREGRDREYGAGWEGAWAAASPSVRSKHNCSLPKIPVIRPLFEKVFQRYR